MDSIQTSELQDPGFGLNTNWLLKPLLWWNSAVWGKKRGTINKFLVYLCIYDEFIGEPWQVQASFCSICYLVPPYLPVSQRGSEPEQSYQGH